MKTRTLRGLTALLVLASALRGAPETLFDGKSLAGWDGDLKWWRIQDGCLTGGSLTEKVPRNFFRLAEIPVPALAAKPIGAFNVKSINSPVKRSKWRQLKRQISPLLI